MMRRTTSSRLRQKLTLQNETRTPDGVGGYTRSWTDVADLWAEIEPTTGKEKLFAMQMESAVTHRITLRANIAVNTSQRLIGDGRSFNILTVAPIHNGELLELLAEEKPL